MKNNVLKFVLLAFFALFYVLPALAQEGDPGTGGGFGDEDPDPAPVDNWVLVLILAGVALGTYFLLQSRKKTLA